MKKTLFMIAVAAAALCCSCTKDLKDRVSVLEDKVAKLEEQVNKNVDSIEQLIEAAKNAVTITSVAEAENGYTITFSDGKVATITNGEDAVAPTIGFKEIDGVFYWTVNGELIKNGGENVPVTGKDGVDGKTPQFKIENGVWKVSFDGETWEDVPVTGTVAPTLVMTETDTEYVFTLGENVIKIAKYFDFAIKAETEVNFGFAGDVIEFNYTLTGADETTYVYVESKGYEYKLDTEAQKLYVTAPKEDSEAEYIVLNAVRNSDSKKAAQYIVIDVKSRYGEKGGIIITDNNPYTEW